MKEIIEIIEYWKQSEVNLNDGISLKKIEMLEKRISFKFPQAFKFFYNEINGFKDCDWSENMFTLYSIERIEEEYLDSQNEMFVPFCDYLINSHQIGFNKLDDHIYIDYHLDKRFNDKVAKTFEKCLIEIIKDSNKIY